MDKQEPAVPVEYGLVEKFVVVASSGGPYDDDAFVAGVAWARIEADLALHMPDEVYVVPPALVAQLDLSGMRHGFTSTVEPWEDGQDYVLVRFTKTTPL